MTPSRWFPHPSDFVSHSPTDLYHTLRSKTWNTSCHCSLCTPATHLRCTTLRLACARGPVHFSDQDNQIYELTSLNTFTQKDHYDPLKIRELPLPAERSKQPLRFCLSHISIGFKNLGRILTFAIVPLRNLEAPKYKLAQFATNKWSITIFLEASTMFEFPLVHLVVLITLRTLVIPPGVLLD